MPTEDTPDSYNVFLAWSGPVSHKIARQLQGFLEDVIEDCRPWVSSQDIKYGKDWRASLRGALAQVRLSILCLTDENYGAPWLAFEAGAAWKAMEANAVCPFLFDRDPGLLEGPLEGFQGFGRREEDMLRLTKQVHTALHGSSVKALEVLQRRFKNAWPNQASDFEAVAAQSGPKKLFLERVRDLNDAVQDLARSDNVDPVLLALSGQFLDEAREKIKKLVYGGAEFELPYMHYPTYHLGLLQSNPAAVVKAVAIVDKDEHFWRSRVGSRIMAATSKQSKRVFVFNDQDHFEENAAMVAEHAPNYHVYVMARASLKLNFPPFDKDFSIVEWHGGQCLARYNKSSFERTIIFSVDQTAVRDHVVAFDAISVLAVPVSPNFDAADKAQIADMVERTFSEVTRYDRMPVEMSNYIHIDEYDQHEEKHAYYQAMMAEMLKQHRDFHGGAANTPKRVLEFGAGTGIFSKRIVAQPNTELIAVEIDYVCYNRLRSKAVRMEGDLKKIGSSMSPIQADSRFYNPPGTFDTIFSSFADHHIRARDKQAYFRNVRINLNAKACFIVGDEFVPDHDETLEGYQAALRLYHNHIIDIARAEGQHELVALESAALDSGLRGEGDFKITCAQYERELARAGLRVRDKIKMGPKDDDAVGGVYVYVIV